MAKEVQTHVIADEKLGGIEREYVEVDRQAEVGDWIINNKGTDAEEYFKVTGYSHKYCPSYDVDFSGKENDDEYITAVSIDRSITLEPTDIVVIDGARYRMVERKAEVGEKVLGKAGKMREVKDVLASGMLVLTRGGYYTSDYYRVLEPISAPINEAEALADELLTVDTSQASPQVVDLLANLAGRVTKLEARNERIIDDLGWNEMGPGRIANLRNSVSDIRHELRMLDEEFKQEAFETDDWAGKVNESIEGLESRVGALLRAKHKDDEPEGNAKAPANDVVNAPAHYNAGKYEVIDIIAQVAAGYDDSFVSYCVGNTQKYIARAPFKGKLAEDLKKAERYLRFAIDHLES